ncbi:MAG: HD domain-containing phosphohydrolase [Candidatus Eremiobacteraeota bacterium]|nr:HD domain-containing phosphohydrolase [Candidatus Eremiobacteraeota bacterium]
MQPQQQPQTQERHQAPAARQPSGESSFPWTGLSASPVKPAPLGDQTWKPIPGSLPQDRRALTPRNESLTQGGDIALREWTNLKGEKVKVPDSPQQQRAAAPKPEAKEPPAQEKAAILQEREPSPKPQVPGKDQIPPGKSEATDIYRSVLKSLIADKEIEPSQQGGLSQKARESQTEQPKPQELPRELQRLAPQPPGARENETPQDISRKAPSSREQVTADKLAEQEETRAPQAKDPALAPREERLMLRGSDSLREAFRKETEQARKPSEPSEAPPREEPLEAPRAPISSKTSIPAARERKTDEGPSRQAIEGQQRSAGQGAEKPQIMASWVASSALPDEGRPYLSRGAAHKEQDKFASFSDKQMIERVEKHERGSGGQGQEQGSSGDGQERGRSRWSSMPQNAPARSEAQKSQPAPQQAAVETFKKAAVEKQRETVTRIVQASRQAPIRLTEEAAKHAATSIESILKKSQKETWTGDEMATKLIALLMKSSSEYTYDHSTRVIDLSVMLAKEMGITEEETLRDIEEGAMFHDIGEVELDLRMAPPQVKSRLAHYIGVTDLKNCSFLHDIGKIKIPEEVLYKPSRLTDEEYEIIKQHPLIGEEILRPIPAMQHVLPVVRHHHERWDGKGYPDGQSGSDIPLPARIIAITDAFDAMVSDRPYRKGIPLEDALAEIRKNSGVQFDPDLVQAFLQVVDKHYR